MPVPTRLGTIGRYGVPQMILGAGDTCTDAWHRQKVVIDHSKFSSLFTHDIPPALWLVYENGTEVPTATSTGATWSNVEGGVAKVNSNGNTTAMVGRRHPRYQPNRGIIWSDSVFFPSPTADGERSMGIGILGADGIYFKLKSTGLYACLKRGGVEYKEELIDLPPNVDLTKGNIFDIQAQYRGVGDIDFLIGNPITRVVECRHTIYNLNTLDGLSTGDGAMSVFFESTNTTEDVEMWVGCVDLSSEGGNVTREVYGSATVTNYTRSAGDPIIVVSQPETINSKHNSRDIRLASIEITASKKATAGIFLTRDMAGITGGSFVSVNSGSYVETDSTIHGGTPVTSVVTTGMRLVRYVPLAIGIPKTITNPSPNTIDFFLIGKDQLLVTCAEGAAVDFDVTVEWGEDL